MLILCCVFGDDNDFQHGSGCQSSWRLRRLISARKSGKSDEFTSFETVQNARMGAFSKVSVSEIAVHRPKWGVAAFIFLRKHDAFTGTVLFISALRHAHTCAE